MKHINKFIFMTACIVILISCKKDRYIFTMKTIKLNSYHKGNLPDQNLSIKVVDKNNSSVLATTDSYPSTLTLPATFSVKPHIQVHLYKEDNIEIQLWGETSGQIASSTIDMDEYKIIYPIDMETESEFVSFSVAGTWK